MIDLKGMKDWKEVSKTVWTESPAGSSLAKDLEPGTKEFFETVLKKRINETDWLYNIINFEKLRGKKVIEVGCGVGYDAYYFLKHGAIYKGCDLSPVNVKRAIMHLKYYGYEADIFEADAERLPFESSSFDFYYSFGVLHHVPNFEKCLNEARRVLKEGGEGIIVVYNKNSIFYRITFFMYNFILKGNFLRYSINEYLGFIEYTTASVRPYVKVYTKQELKNHFENARLKILNMYIGKLEPEDLPVQKIFRKFYEKIPKRIFDFLGERYRWYIAVHFRKEN
ncbi:MAG: class I SAM-dependent methyltransferase [Thermodesulfovibrio sp.]|nr:class I SAM-dependent methyltransferase [Thermodesulfovibrio sp.]